MPPRGKKTKNKKKIRVYVSEANKDIFIWDKRNSAVSISGELKKIKKDEKKKKGYLLKNYLEKVIERYIFLKLSFKVQGE